MSSNTAKTHAGVIAANRMKSLGADKKTQQVAASFADRGIPLNKLEDYIAVAQLLRMKTGYGKRGTKRKKSRRRKITKKYKWW